MILSLRRSVRSFWSLPVVAVGLVFAILGVAMLVAPAEPGETQGTLVSGLIIGIGCLVIGLAFAWAGARVGVFREGDRLKVRELFGRTTTYEPAQVSGFTTRDDAHHSVPLMLIQVVIVTADGSEAPIPSLATYRALPGARRQALTAIRRMSEWTGRPILPS